MVSMCQASRTIWIPFKSPSSCRYTYRMEAKLQINWTISQLPSNDLDWGFSTLKLLTFGIRLFFILGEEGHPVHPRMLSSLSGLCPLEDSSTPTVGTTTKNISRHCHMSLGEWKQNWNHRVRQICAWSLWDEWPRTGFLLKWQCSKL